MLGALGAMGGGAGGMSASSSASSSLDSTTSNNISSGTITVGGLNMAPKVRGLSSDEIMRGGVVLVLIGGAYWGWKKLKS